MRLIFRGMKYALLAKVASMSRSLLLPKWYRLFIRRFLLASGRRYTSLARRYYNVAWEYGSSFEGDARPRGRNHRKMKPENRDNEAILLAIIHWGELLIIIYFFIESIPLLIAASLFLDWEASIIEFL